MRLLGGGEDGLAEEEEVDPGDGRVHLVGRGVEESLHAGLEVVLGRACLEVVVEGVSHLFQGRRGRQQARHSLVQSTLGTHSEDR